MIAINDREKPVPLANMQAGFIHGLVLPLYKKFAELPMLDLSTPMGQLHANLKVQYSPPAHCTVRLHASYAPLLCCGRCGKTKSTALPRWSVLVRVAQPRSLRLVLVASVLAPVQVTHIARHRPHLSADVRAASRRRRHRQRRVEECCRRRPQQRSPRCLLRHLLRRRRVGDLCPCVY